MVIKNNTVSQEKLVKHLVDITVDKTKKDEDTVRKIINFQFKDAFEATKTKNEVEISGFGKFNKSQSKIKRKIAKWEKMITQLKKKEEEGLLEDQRTKNEYKIKTVSEKLDILKTKLIINEN